MFRLLIASATVAALLTLPAAALAMHAPGDAPAAAPVSAPANYLGDGKYSPRPAVAAAQPQVQIVRVVKPVGFDFRDAGIGAGLGALLVAALCTALIFTLRTRGSALAVGSGAS